MTDPNHPPSFHYHPHQSPTEYYENESNPFFAGGDPRYPQASLGPPSNYDMISGPSEPGPGPSRIVFDDGSLNKKVQIPRSTNPSTWTTSGRVSRACENCRDQKAKCSGHRPTCQRCQESGLQCSYGDRKREKMAKQLNDLTNQVQVYEALLKELCSKLDSQTAEYVEQVIEKQRLSNNPAPGRRGSTMSLASRMTDASPLPSPGPNPFLGGLDYTSEDFNRDEKTQAIGFIGEHSEIAWLHRLQQILDCPNTVSPHEKPNQPSISSVNFFLDDSDVPFNQDADPGKRPPQAVADQLVGIYFNVVNHSFPIIGKSLFLEQYKCFYTRSVRPGDQWLAILNLVFAIAVRHSEPARAGPRDGVDDHLFYFSRAWKLTMSGAGLLEHPNLQQIQVEGLISFYLSSVGHINRSWRICGMALRSAGTMGLNLRNESKPLNPPSKEARYRVWWALYIFDLHLCVLTGRPPNSSDEFCTTPLPVPFEEETFNDAASTRRLMKDNEARGIFMETLGLGRSGYLASDGASPDTPGHSLPSPGRQCDQIASSAFEALEPNPSLYFLHIVDLGFIVREAIDTLYAPGAARMLWREIEVAISTLNGKIDAWLTRLPVAFQFTQGTRGFERERTNMAFFFHSAKILVAQPCFSRLTRQTSGTDITGNFCESMAIACVDLAVQMLEIFPEHPDSSWIYGVSPWWFLLHLLMQPIAIIMTELLLAKPGAAKRRKLLAIVSKATRWLAELSTKDPAFQRGEEVCRELAQHDPQLAMELYTDRERH
ncbi:hypothetical protein P170DRAFT_353359 [Aspergillus steynii IBT 23096]|uniref:Zn(2)-C6 fungal-type domain-containing protein n=1 Tax=Aspergillus steynii IBT 23096 TaxID=1392250 RepID=A0A2I2GC09_9EURO|nr:uncharacterized protein P170DRAFT_353359 [Aspergillus steynii IBT 23096]PLB50406.1 hypothetical protein P170DRAFT_353359 [Aspergillus steynii IBT 23096]